MNAGLVEMWNRDVKPKDTVYFLGDFSMKYRIALEYFPRLNGEIHWIVGNHDSPFKEVYAKAAISSAEYSPSKELRDACPNIKSIAATSTHEWGGKKFVLSHFPWLGEADEHSAEHNQYDDRFKDNKLRKEDFPEYWLLSGHRHSNPKDRVGDRVIDVGVDPWNMSMVSLEQILNVINIGRL